LSSGRSTPRIRAVQAMIKLQSATALMQGGNPLLIGITVTKQIQTLL